MLRNLMCRAFGHRIDRRRVWNDGMDFRASCARCRVPMLRDPGGWREFDGAKDSHSARKAHPRRRLD